MPVFNNILAGAAGQGGASDAGHAIEQSLRFDETATAHLHTTFGSFTDINVGTISVWVKRSKLGAGVIAAGWNGSVSYSGSIQFNSSDNTLQVSVGGNADNTFKTHAVLRDVSAWYHIVAHWNRGASGADKIKCWINGVAQTSSTTTYHSWTSGDAQVWASNSGNRIGRGDADRYNNLLNGYLAEYHFVDGQALSETDFGEFDSNGTWKPKQFSGTYGNNGFYLKLNPNATGAVTYSADFVSQTGNYYQGNRYPTRAFDGNLSTTCDTQNANEWLEWTPTGGYAYTSSVEVHTQQSSGTYEVNGGSSQTLSSPNNSWNTVATGSGTITSLKVYGDGGNYGAVSGIRVDGKILIDEKPLGLDSSGNNNHWHPNNITAAGPGVVTTGDVTLSNTTRNFYFKGSAGDTISTTVGNHIWDSSNGATWTYRGTTSTSVSLTSTYILLTGGTNIGFTNSSSATVKYWDLALSSGIGNGAPSGGAGSTAVYNIEARGFQDIDSVLDSPTNLETASGDILGNYATLNALVPSNQTVSDGNLHCAQSANNWGGVPATIGMTSGKFQFECIPYDSYYAYIGIANADADGRDFTNGNFSGYIGGSPNSWGLLTSSGHLVHNTQNVQTGGAQVWNDYVVTLTFDADIKQAKWYVNGSLYYTQTLTGPAPFFFSVGCYTATCSVNFGQKPFIHPVTGFKGVCTQNLDDPLIADPSTAFGVKTFAGNGGTQTVSGLNMSPDLVWLKSRSSAENHSFFDSVRGAPKGFHTNNTDAEFNDPSTLTGFTNDGWTMAGHAVTNGNNKTYAGWAWDAGTVGTNEVGDYWSPSTYQTKYIGFKFPTSSGGRAVFGLTSGTGTADIFTSSDNSSWTRVQSNVTLSTTDTTYDSTSQYLIVVNTSNAVWGATHYAMATNGTDAHYSTQTYPGSGASFTWSGPTYDDWDFRSSGTVIKPGSLSGSLFVSNAIYSNDLSSNDSGGVSNASQAFDGDLSTRANNATSADTHRTLVWSPSTAITFSEKFEVYCDQGNSTPVAIWNNNTVSASGGEWVTVYTGSGTISSTYPLTINTINAPQWATLKAVRLDGKILVDSNLTTPSVPSIASTVRANPTAGFSVITTNYPTYSGTSSIAHMLNAEPHMWVIKDRDSADGWYFGHKAIGANYYMRLESTMAKALTTSLWGNTFPDSNVIYNNGSSMSQAGSYLILAWTSVEGFSKFGSYVSTNNAEGPFVYLGFQAKLIVWKNADAAHGWYMYDDERDPDNPMSLYLAVHSNNAEGGPGGVMDVLSNGFKVRNTGSDMNTGSNTIVYMAWAESPFKNSRAR